MFISPVEFIFIVLFAVAIWTVFDILRQPSEKLPPSSKALWIMATIVFPLIGAIIYFAAGRPRRAVS